MSVTADPRIERVRVFRRFHGLALRRLAIKANVELGDVLDMDKPDWDPPPATLAALDRVIPSTFSVATPTAGGSSLHQRDSDDDSESEEDFAPRFNRRRGRHGR